MLRADLDRTIYITTPDHCENIIDQGPLSFPFNTRGVGCDWRAMHAHHTRFSPLFYMGQLDWQES